MDLEEVLRLPFRAIRNLSLHRFRIEVLWLPNLKNLINSSSCSRMTMMEVILTTKTNYSPKDKTSSIIRSQDLTRQLDHCKLVKVVLEEALMELIMTSTRLRLKVSNLCQSIKGKNKSSKMQLLETVSNLILTMKLKMTITERLVILLTEDSSFKCFSNFI